MKRIPKQDYTAEFKKQAVKRAEEVGSIARTAEELGLVALGRKNWLFAGSPQAGQRAVAIMSLIQSARLNGHEPFAYLKDVLERLPSHAVHGTDCKSYGR